MKVALRCGIGVKLHFASKRDKIATPAPDRASELSRTNVADLPPNPVQYLLLVYPGVGRFRFPPFFHAFGDHFDG